MDEPTPSPFAHCRVLIVEDVLPLSMQYRALARPLGVQTKVAETVAAAREQIAQGPWHAALVDINLPDGSGFEVMQAIKRRWPACAVIVITGEDSLDNAVRAADAGAMDFIEKPVEPERLRITLRNALNAALLEQKVQVLEPRAPDRFHGFVGRSPAMQAVYGMIGTVAASRAPVFIHGESGTGKELAAQAIHQCSPRASAALVPLNCAAIPKELMESELFGHVRGAFTGATADRNGAFIEADGGTLFLDEIAEMDISVQAKLLRVLQTGEVRRLGESRLRMVDVRVVCASHRDLYAQVRAGRFREDLFYRLYVVPIELPPLRERGEDVLLIAQALLEHHARDEGKRLRRFSAAARRLLMEHRWPGNVRELGNVVRAVVALNDGAEVTPAMLGNLRAYAELPGSADLGVLDGPAALAARVPGPVASMGVATASASASASAARVRPLAQVEREAIEQALQVFAGNVSQAARALGVNASTLYRKMAAWAHASGTEIGQDRPST